MESDWEGKVFFMDAVEYQMTGQGMKRNPTVGVYWMHGMISETEFEQKQKDGVGNEEIELLEFPGKQKRTAKWIHTTLTVVCH